MEKHVYAVLLSDLVMFIKIVSDVIDFHNPYSVKSVNFAFKPTHVCLFRSVYHDVNAPRNVKVN